MAQEIGKIQLNFQVVDTGDPKLLLVQDFSKWRVIENMPSYIEITLPGSKSPITVPFEKYAVNGFNSLSLGTSCHVDCEENLIPLPDGIYCLTIKGGQDGMYEFSRYYLKKDKLQTDLDKAWVRLGIDYDLKDENFRNRLLYIEGYLRAASAATRLGKIPEAQDYFRLAEKEIRSYVECKNCY